MTQRSVPLFVFVFALGQTALAQEVAIVPRISPVRTEAQPAALPQTVVRVESSLVLIPTHVTNANGSPVINLSADAFHLYEDNVQQTIASFNAEDAPISVGLLFDASGSMRNKMEKASQAASRFFATANPGDEFFLIEIGGRARLVSPFTTDSDDLLERIQHFRSGGQTPLFDAIHLAMKEMKSAHNSRKALVILSDGGDNWSTHTFRQIHEALIESDMQVYAIGIFDEDFARNHTPEESKGPMLLDELTSQTGGRLFSVARLEDLPEIGARISRELRQQYVLGYYSSNGVRDGKFRHVKVTVSSEETEIHVSARKGYYAPGR
jgi:Ca-activated chloride channel homolog